MKIQSLKMAYFSPTGITKVVVQGIAPGINPGTTELIDVTQPRARKQALQAWENDLLVIAIPVYMGRVLALLNEWLNTIQANNTPTVCVVLYGNHAFENALLELKDIVIKHGCIPIAGEAYIGEHSFSNSEEPTAQGRPDEDDLNHAKLFGQKTREKLHCISSISQVSEIDIPSTYPYGGITELWNVDFFRVNNQCIECGTWAEVCPLVAIDSQDSKIINQVKCITYYACIKNCAQNVRAMKPGPVKDAAKRIINCAMIEKSRNYF